MNRPELCNECGKTPCPYGDKVPSSYIRRMECPFNPKKVVTVAEKIRVGQQKQKRKKR